MIGKIKIYFAPHFLMVLILGILANCDILDAAQKSTSSNSASPSKELMQIIALNNKKGKKSAKNGGMLKRMYAATMRMVQSPVNYVFGKKPSGAKKVFYGVFGLTILLSIGYGSYQNWEIIEAWLKGLLDKKEEEPLADDDKDEPGSSNASDNKQVGRQPEAVNSQPIKEPTNQDKTNTDSKQNDNNEPKQVQQVAEQNIINNGSAPTTDHQVQQNQDKVKKEEEMVPRSPTVSDGSTVRRRVPKPRGPNGEMLLPQDGENQNPVDLSSGEQKRASEINNAPAIFSSAPGENDNSQIIVGPENGSTKTPRDEKNQGHQEPSIGERLSDGINWLHNIMDKAVNPTSQQDPEKQNSSEVKPNQDSSNGAPAGYTELVIPPTKPTPVEPIKPNQNSAVGQAEEGANNLKDQKTIEIPVIEDLKPKIDRYYELFRQDEMSDREREEYNSLKAELYAKGAFYK